MSTINEEYYEENYPNKLGIILKKLRQEQKISQRALGKIIGVEQSAIAQYELGIRIPKPKILHDICRYFNVTPDVLLGYERYMHISVEEYRFIQIFRNNPDLFESTKKMIEAAKKST